MKKLKIFIAGHKGMVGSAIVRKLLNENCSVIKATKKELNLLRQGDTDNWIKENDVYANLLEDDLSEKFWPNAKQPITDIPVFHNDGEFLIVENTNRSNGASIGYSYDGKKWKVYSGPLKTYPRKNIFLKSVKYGWRESEVVKIEF